MAAAVACARFSQNAWRREMCSNCFKAKTEHAPPPPRPQPPPPTAQPKKSILKGVGKRPERIVQRSNVCFHSDEPEIIGHYGGDISDDDESDCDSPHQNGNDLPDGSGPELSVEDDKVLQDITQKNTDFNSDNANLLIASNGDVKTNGDIMINGDIKTNGEVKKSAPSRPEPKAEVKKCVPVVCVTPFGSKPTAVCAPTPKERVVVVERVAAERRPPLGHEATTKISVKVQEIKEVVKQSIVKIQVPPVPTKPVEQKEEPQKVEDKLDAFIHHKNSMELSSPPRSPLIMAKNEERPAPIGKVATEPPISVNSDSDCKESSMYEKRKKNGAKLSEAKSSSLIRRWTVGERVLIQPRRPIMDAPEIVPLNLHSSVKLEPRELSGEPDGEDSSSATVVDGHPPALTVEEKPEVVAEEEVEEDKPPTPPSSPVPEAPELPSTPPPVVQDKTPPARPTSLPGAATARSTFLHSTMMGKPIIPAKPASLSLGTGNWRHSTIPVAVASPVTPAKVDVAPKETSSTPQNSTPEMSFIYETPKFDEKPPLISLRPRMGSHKKRQAPKPPKEDVSSPDSIISLESSPVDLCRRDSVTSMDKSSLQSKKLVGRFSLRRLLRIGSKEERPISPESPMSSPSPPDTPNRPEIIHPLTLDGRQVEVVSRMQQQQLEQAQSPPTSPVMSITSTTPPARPKPPPPPRTMSLPQSPSQRPARPPPPQSLLLLQMREKAIEQNQTENEDSIYANLDSLKKNKINTADRLARMGAVKESSTENSSENKENGDYEMVQFKDGTTVRRRRSVIFNSLEENYGAVVGANHRALAQLLEALGATPLPNDTTSVSVPCYAGECRHPDEKSLVLLQILAQLEQMQQAGSMSATLDQFRVIRPKDSELNAVGPRVQTSEVGNGGTKAALGVVAGSACQLLAPTETAVAPLLEAGQLRRAIALLEWRAWGPEVGDNGGEREVSMQRWLDLERATALQTLARHKRSERLALTQEMFVRFLVDASAVALAQASKMAA